ncbi:uncharacterized protein LOC111896449 [Lactuca sativa]|uniref:uncharacterized protein LOC111896449 n=1 Tax=Lactuca sativa TaxID=4236 RepID=UPI0022AF5B7D|nr:uncharacterized protein LOC111896449 [Lactuca sativa]
MNKTSNDPFLSKLCVDDDDENNIVDDDNGREVEVNIQTHFIFNEPLHWKKQKPIIWMGFKVPRKRRLVRCSKGACTFRLWASWMSDEESFQINSLKVDHSCARNFKFGSLVTYAWIGSHYAKEIVQSQKISVRKLRVKVMDKFGIQFSMGQCRREKKYALNLVEGSLVEHYGKLWSYGHEILRTNPGSIVKLDMRMVQMERNILGEMICAIGRDVNDKIYPIAWVVVNVENKQNYKWFLELLIDDLNLNLGNDFSLMSDQHKGLIEVVKELLPYVEHRQYARHICQNLQKRFNSVIYHTLLWRASKATTEHAFKVVMKEIETLNPDAHQYLMEKDPKTW